MYKLIKKKKSHRVKYTCQFMIRLRNFISNRKSSNCHIRPLNRRCEYSGLYFYRAIKVSIVVLLRVLTCRDRLTRIKNGMIGSIDRSDRTGSLLDRCRRRRYRRYRRYRGSITDESRWRLGCSTRVDVLESYRDKKGHPKDTPGSGRRNAITIDIDSLGTYRWRDTRF